eukprot:1186935-Pyramimonas_sp.AAC.1
MPRRRARQGPGPTMPKTPRFSTRNCSTASLRSALPMLNHRLGRMPGFVEQGNFLRHCAP